MTGELGEPSRYQLIAACERHGRELWLESYGTQKEAQEYARRNPPPPCNTDTGVWTHWEIMPIFNL